MNQRGYVAGCACSVAVSGIWIGILTDNPNWPANLPLGMVIGALYGFGSWAIYKRFIR